jgi:hypothetical protein
LVLNGFRLFSEIKSALKRPRFLDIEDIKKQWRPHWKQTHNRSKV